VSGSSPSGRVTTRTSSPFESSTSAARNVAFCPGASESYSRKTCRAYRPSSLGLRLGERGAHRRDDALDPRRHQPERVEVPLHEDHALVATDRVARLVQVVEDLPLLEDLRVGGVEVLRLPRPEQAPAEPDEVPARVVDGEHQPVAEPRPRLLVLLALHQEPRREEPRVVVAEAVEVRAHRAELLGREADAEPLGERTRHVAAREIVARRLPARRIPQHALESTRPTVACSSHIGSRGSGPSRLRSVSFTSTPHFSPTYFTASTKLIPSRFCTNVNTEPFSPQTKQVYPRPGTTEKFALVPWWNGQGPRHTDPSS
jgi:hypothetical protein